MPLQIKPVPAKCLRTAVVPRIDGKLDDDCWKTAKPIDNFTVLGKATPSQVDTKVRMLYNGTKVYFAIWCPEPKMDTIKADTTQRDGPVYNEDSVELFFDPDQDGNYIQLCVNSLGTIFDSRKANPKWNGKWQVAAEKTNKGWSAEILFDLESASMTIPAAETTWKFNVCRSRVGGDREQSSWSLLRKKFHEPRNFGTLIFE